MRKLRNFKDERDDYSKQASNVGVECAALKQNFADTEGILLNKIKTMEESHNEIVGLHKNQIQSLFQERIATVQDHEMKIRKCNFFCKKKVFFTGDLYLKTFSVLSVLDHFFQNIYHIGASVCVGGEVTFKFRTYCMTKTY